VFEIKRCGKFRTRLCALGYTQDGGQDFTDNFESVIKEETFCIVLILVKLKKWKKYVVDVEIAFFYGNLEETIFMTKPVGYHDIIEALKKDGIISDDVDEKKFG